MAPFDGFCKPLCKQDSVTRLKYITVDGIQLVLLLIDLCLRWDTPLVSCDGHQNGVLSILWTAVTFFYEMYIDGTFEYCMLCNCEPNLIALRWCVVLSKICLYSMGLEDHVHTPGVHFHNLGLWGSDFVNKENWTLLTLSSIRRQLGHRKVNDPLLYIYSELFCYR